MALSEELRKEALGIVQGGAWRHRAWESDRNATWQSALLAEILAFAEKVRGEAHEAGLEEAAVLMAAQARQDRNVLLVQGLRAKMRADAEVSARVCEDAVAAIRALKKGSR